MNTATIAAIVEKYAKQLHPDKFQENNVYCYKNRRNDNTWHIFKNADNVYSVCLWTSKKMYSKDTKFAKAYLP